MGACKNACEANEETAWADLAGVDIQHDLHLALRDWTAWSAIAERLASAGADVQSLQLARSEDGVSVRCRLNRVTPQSARALIGSLLDEGIAERGGVEHLVLPKHAASATR